MGFMTQDGRELQSWDEYKPTNTDFSYGALSGIRRRKCDIAGLPAGEPKPVSLYVGVPRECEPPEHTITW